MNSMRSIIDLIYLKTMYEDLDSFERALMHFGTRVDVVCAMEMGHKIDSETAYQLIKQELKSLKKIRKGMKKNGQPEQLNE